MARLLIGSSNINRFYKDSKDQPKYKMELVTLTRAFEVSMESVSDGDKVIISVIENFIEKAIKNVEDGARMKALALTMGTFMTTVIETSKKRPTAKFALAYPILRPANKWMTEKEDEIREEFEKVFNTDGRLNITKIDAIARASQNFERDGVHLTTEAGKGFVSNLIEMAEVAFDAEVIDVGDDDSLFVKLTSAAKDSATALGNKMLHELKKDSVEMKKWRNDLELKLNSRFRNDNVMFARLREEADSETNRRKEDRTLVMGLEEPTNLPRGGPERTDRIKSIAEDFCKKVKPDFDGKIMFAAMIGRPDKGKIRIEFRLDSTEKAREIRKIFAVNRAAKKLEPEIAELHVTTVVTLATRVRMDIMKAIASKIETDTEVAYVPNFLPRPIMHIKRKLAGEQSGSRGHVKTLTFVDSVVEYGNVVSKKDLSRAYDSAKNNFGGMMSQHFLVLEEVETVREPQPGGSGGGLRGVKRPNVSAGGGRGKGGRV